MNKLFGCTGFPRGGTHYAALVMQKLGFKVEAEMMGKEGTSDWRLILTLSSRIDANDKNLVFFDDTEKMCVFRATALATNFVREKYRPYDYDDEKCRALLKEFCEVKYKHKLFFVRNPWHTISTWSQLYHYPMNATTGGAVYIFNYYSKNKNVKYNNLIHQSTAMYLEYAELIEKHCDEIITVENAFEDLNKFFMKNGLEKHINKEKIIIPRAGSTNLERLTVEDIKRNTTKEIFTGIQNFIEKIYNRQITEEFGKDKE